MNNLSEICVLAGKINGYCDENSILKIFEFMCSKESDDIPINILFILASLGSRVIKQFTKSDTEIKVETDKCILEYKLLTGFKITSLDDRYISLNEIDDELKMVINDDLYIIKTLNNRLNVTHMYISKDSVTNLYPNLKKISENCYANKYDLIQQDKNIVTERFHYFLDADECEKCSECEKCGDKRDKFDECDKFDKCSDCDKFDE